VFAEINPRYRHGDFEDACGIVHCRECGAAVRDSDGWDGLCGTCADRRDP
jgi:hypothetical protein